MTFEEHKKTQAYQDSIRIVCAAMLMKDGLVVTGARHFSPEMRLVLHRIYGDGYHLKVQQQGFINQYGDFLGREEALVIARKQGQVRKEVGGGNDELFSEMLY
jgi:hypothetical protein